MPRIAVEDHGRGTHLAHGWRDEAAKLLRRGPGSQPIRLEFGHRGLGGEVEQLVLQQGGASHGDQSGHHQPKQHGTHRHRGVCAVVRLHAAGLSAVATGSDPCRDQSATASIRPQRPSAPPSAGAGLRCALGTQRRSGERSHSDSTSGIIHGAAHRLTSASCRRHTRSMDMPGGIAQRPSPMIFGNQSVTSGDRW